MKESSGDKLLTEELKPYISSLKSGESVVGLMPESYYLEVKRTTASWRFRIQSFNQQSAYNTTWVQVEDFYKLETARMAKKIRQNLGKIYPGREEEALYEVISQLELYQSYWEPEVAPMKPKEPNMSDKMVELVLGSNVLLFCDQHDDPHIRIPMEILVTETKKPEIVTGVTGVTVCTGSR